MSLRQSHIFRPIRPLARSLLRDQRGTIVILFAVLLPVLLGMGALAVDAAHLYVVRTQLQAAADTAVLAAVQELPNVGAARAAAKSYAQKNAPWGAKGEVLKMQDVEVGYWDAASRTFTADAGRAEAVRVTVRRAGANGNPVPTFFAGLFGLREVDVAAEAVAGRRADPLCVLALEPTAQDAIKLDGASKTHMHDCRMQINSTSNKALKVASDAYATAAAITVAGGVYSHPQNVAEYTETGAPEVPDPLAGLQTPSYGGCDQTETKIDGGTHVLWPGVYCKGISIKSATVTFRPGIYVVTEKPLLIDGAGTRVEGEGVAFFLADENAVIDFRQPSRVELSAPTSGELAGILFFQARVAKMEEHKVVDEDNKVFEGALYFPSGKFTHTAEGTAGNPSPFTIIIARIFEFKGDGTMDINSDYVLSDVPTPAGLGGRGGIGLFH